MLKLRKTNKLSYLNFIKRFAHVLTDAEIAFYNENGYILVRNNLTTIEVEKYNQRFIDIVTGKVERPKNMTMMKDISLIKKLGDVKIDKNVTDERTVTKIQDFQEESGIFGYCVEPAILDNVRRLLGNDIYTIHTMFINKPSDLGTGSSRHPPHQDLLYFPFRPVDGICAAWTAMQPITAVNGCLFVLPKSHKGPLLKHEYPNDGIVNKAYHGIQNMGAEGMMNVEMDPGDTLYFHPLLIHGSGPNMSKEFRKAISCHYCASGVTEVDIRGTLQEEIGREVEGMAKMKSKVDIKFIDIWRMKCRHVSGVSGQTFKMPLIDRIRYTLKLLYVQATK